MRSAPQLLGRPQSGTPFFEPRGSESVDAGFVFAVIDQPDEQAAFKRGPMS